MEPTLGHGKICYLELPARDVAEATAFYGTVFEWNIRHGADGRASFDDSVGQVSGTFVRGATAVTAPFVHVMVRSVPEVLAAITAHGGTVIEGPGRHLPEITGRFSDPTGNVFSVYEERSLARA